MTPRDSSAPDAGGRIESHSKGVGPLTPELVEERARELARIEGRTENEVTADDRVRARRELADEDLTLTSDEASASRVASSNPADMAVDTGHAVKAIQPNDEQLMAEEEVKEGAREAEHERMLRGQDIPEPEM